MGRTSIAHSGRGTDGASDGTESPAHRQRVDPARFPDEEFPVFCEGCGYALRGLPVGRCPECGRPFDRGELLVQQYVVSFFGPKWRYTRLGRVTRWFWLSVVLGCAAIGGLAVAFEKSFDHAQRSGNWTAVNALRPLSWYAAPTLLLVLGLVGLAIATAATVHIVANYRKLRTVLAAIEPPPES